MIIIATFRSFIIQDLYPPVFVRAIKACARFGISWLSVLFLVNTWSPFSVWCTAESRLLETASSWPSSKDINEKYVIKFCCNMLPERWFFGFLSQRKNNNEKWTWQKFVVNAQYPLWDLRAGNMVAVFITHITFSRLTVKPNEVFPARVHKRTYYFNNAGMMHLFLNVRIKINFCLLFTKETLSLLSLSK